MMSSLDTSIGSDSEDAPPMPNDPRFWSEEGQSPNIIESEPILPSTATGDSAIFSTATLSSAGLNQNDPIVEPAAPDPAPIMLQPMFIKTVGKVIVGFQGDHPIFFPSNRPLRGPPYGQATLVANHAPPWGRISAPYRIQRDMQWRFPMIGYEVGVYGDDGLRTTNLLKASLGGNHIFDQGNIGLFIGHSSSTKETIVALSHRQSYIPIYNQATGVIDWVGMNDMRWGSSTLKWMAFYSCNLFRDDPATYPAYADMKNNEHLAMSTDLHIMQAYVTESSIHPAFAYYWAGALSGQTGNSANHRVVGAWNYVCRHTQPKFAKDPSQNIARSACWPECVNDYAYGYGPQTDPDPSHIQGELIEVDAHANDPEP